MGTRKRIIAFAGRNGSGKETAADRAAVLLGTKERHTYSDILVDTYRLWGYERSSRPDQQALSTFMRGQKGEDALARAMTAKCRKAPPGWISIDGVRRLTDLDLLLAEFGAENIVMVWIETSADIRYARLKARKEKQGESMMTREEFDAQEQAESERQLDAVRAACAYEICNNGTLEALLLQVDTLVHDLLAVAHG